MKMWGEERREGKGREERGGTHTRATSAYVGCEWNRDESKNVELDQVANKAEERQRQGRKKR